MIAPRDMIIAKVHYKDTLSGGNIIIPDILSTKQNLLEYYGEVVSVGPTSPFRRDLEPGDKFIFHRNEGVKIKDGQGNEFISLKPRAVLCKDMI